MSVCISSIALSRNIQNQVLKPFLSRATFHTMALLWERLGYWNFCTHFVSQKFCESDAQQNPFQYEYCDQSFQSKIHSMLNEKRLRSRDKPLIWILRSKFSYILWIFHLAYLRYIRSASKLLDFFRCVHSYVQNNHLDSEILFQSEFGEKSRFCTWYLNDSHL